MYDGKKNVCSWAVRIVTLLCQAATQRPLSKVTRIDTSQRSSLKLVLS